MRLILALLLCPLAWGETCTSTGSGAWSGAIWSGCTPTDDDTYIISVGYTVDYDANIVHTGPITVNGTLRGSGTRLLILSNVALAVAAGGALTNTGGVFEIQIGGAHSQAAAKLLLSGTAGSHCTVTGESATNYIKFTDGGYLRGGKVTATYADLDYVGTVGASPAVPSFSIYPSSADDYIWQHCTFGAHTGRIERGAYISATAVFRLEDSQFLTTAQNISGTLTNAAMTTGTRSIQRNWFGGAVGDPAGVGSWYSFTISHNVIRQGIWSTSTSDYPWAELSNNVVGWIGPANAAMTFCGPTAYTGPNYIHAHSNAGTIANAHALQPCKANSSAISGLIIEPGDTDDQGDMILIASPTVARSWTISRNLLLLNKNGAHAGSFISALGNANCTVTVQRNTWFPTTDAAEGGAITQGEGYAGHAGLFADVSSNLVVGGGNGYVYVRRNLSTVSDAAAAASLHHNGRWALTGTGYADKTTQPPTAPMFSSGSPGANDVAANPGLVDPTRRITTWAVARGYTSASAYNDRSDAAYTALKTDIAARIEDLIAWVQAGYAPTNAAFRGTGSGGVDIGAMDWVARGSAMFPMIWGW